VSAIKKDPVVIYGAVVRALTQLSGLALFGLGARTLGVADFGIFALAMVFTNIVQNFLYSGVYEFVMRSRPEDRVDHTALVLNMLISIAGASLSVLVGWLISGRMGQPEIFKIAAAMAPSALICGTTAWHEAQVLRRRRFNLYYSNWVITEYVSAAVGAVLLLKGGGLYSLVVYRYLQQSLMFVGYTLFGPVSYLGPVRVADMRRILAFAGPIYGSRLLSSISNYGADLVVGILLGPAATGLYRMASRIVASLSEAILQPLRLLTWTRAAAVRGSFVKMSLKLLPLLQIASLFLWPTAVLVSYAAPDILRIALGARWTAATPIIVTLFLARSVEVAELFLEPILANTGRGKLLIVVRIVSIAVLFAGVVAFSRFGPAYVGGANVAAALVALFTVLPPLVRTVGFARVFGAMLDGMLLAAVFAILMRLGDMLGPPDKALLTHIGIVGVCGVALLVQLARRRTLILATR
jgi:O-antigen/teichoic acid export membrane protein